MWLTLVDIGLGVVDVLVLLVTEGVNGSVGAGAEAGIGVLGDLLVGGLGSLGTGALDSLRDVVGSVLLWHVSVYRRKSWTKCEG
jgi:hypothetical protein